MMKRLYCCLFSILLVIGFNYLGIFGVSLATEKCNKNAIEKGSLEEIMLTESSTIELEYYDLLNWGYGDVFTDSEDVMNILKNTQYEKVSHFEQVVVQTLQNRFNSVVMLWLEPNELGVDKRSNEFRKQNDGCGWNLYCVKIFNQYFMIIDYYFVDNGYTDSIDSGLPLTSVYKAVEPEAIEEIDEYKSVGKYYSSYSFYPLDLAHYVSSPFSKALNLLYIFCQCFVVYKFLYRVKDYNKKEILLKVLKTIGALVLICILYFICENVFSYIYNLPAKPT